MEPLPEPLILYYLNEHTFFNKLNYNYLVTSYLLKNHYDIHYHLLRDTNQYSCYRKFPACYGLNITLNSTTIPSPPRLISSLPNHPQTLKPSYNPDNYSDTPQLLKNRLANHTITISEPKTKRIKRIPSAYQNHNAKQTHAKPYRQHTERTSKTYQTCIKP